MYRYLVLLAVLVSVKGQQSLGTIPVALPGFSNIFEHEDTTDPRDRYSVILSTFNPTPFTQDTSYMFRGIGYHLDDLSGVNVSSSALATDLTWPREPTQTPLEVFGFETVTSPEGFIIPFKNRGTINIIDVSDQSNPIVHDIVSDSEGDQKDWFYNNVIWKDMNGDGKFDAVTCRARVIYISGVVESEFVWFEHPEEDIFAQPWQPHILREDIADTFLEKYTFTDSSGEDVEVIFTIGYFSNILAIHRSTHPEGLWTDSSQIETRIIAQDGFYFSVVIEDVNNDGQVDLITTINDEVNGTIWIYEIPDDFMNGEYVPHMLADGFGARSGVDGGGAPGLGKTFYPFTGSTSGKPDLYLSGDDEGTAYLLHPLSEDPNNWDYELNLFFDEGEGVIVGQLSAADVDGDGYTELFIPSYTNGQLHVYTFAP